MTLPFFCLFHVYEGYKTKDEISCMERRVYNMEENKKKGGLRLMYEWRAPACHCNTYVDFMYSSNSRNTFCMYGCIR